MQVPGDPYRRIDRRLLVIVLFGLTLAGLIALQALEERLAAIGRLADVSRDRAIEEFTTLLWWVSLAVTPLTLVVAALIFGYARQTAVSGLCPPPGAILVRDRWVATGPAAQALAIAGYVLAALLAAVAVAFPLAAWWLASNG